MCGWIPLLILAGVEAALASTDETGVMLLQTHAKMLNGPAASGTLVSLSEAGYQSVAALKNDEEMKAFTRRVMAESSLEATASSVDLESHLSGLVPYYSGKAAVQSLTRLREELGQVKWLHKVKKGAKAASKPAASSSPKKGKHTGASAALTEEGYQALAALKSDDEMKVYMRRLVDMAALDPADTSGAELETRLNHLAPHFSGTKHVQSFARLFEDLVTKPWVKHRARNDKPSGLSLLAIGKEQTAAPWQSWLESKFSKHGKPAQDAAPAHGVAAAGVVNKPTRKGPGASTGARAKAAANARVATASIAPPVSLVRADDQETSNDEDNGEVFGAVSSQLSSLRQNLAEEQRRIDAAVSTASSDYEARLTIKQQEIQRAMDANSDASLAIVELRKNSSQLLQTAGELQRRQSNLENELRSLQEDFSTAMEYANESIVNANELNKVPMLEVLSELKVEESSLRAAEAKRHKLDAILVDDGHELKAKRGQQQLAFLELPRDVHDASGPVELLADMSTKLVELDLEASAKTSSLKEAFLTKMEAADHQLEDLAVEAEKMRVTKASLQERVARLKLAVEFLQGTCESLEKKKLALRRYTARLGPS